MNNRDYAWKNFRVSVDIDELVVEPRVCDDECEAGEGLPVDFPRGEFDDDQLVLLAEYWCGKRSEVVRRWYDLLCTVPASGALTLGVIVLNAGILCRLLGFGGEGMTWDEYAVQCGYKKTVLYRQKRAILAKLALMAEEF